MHIDWEALAQRLGCENSGSTRHAQEALAGIFGAGAVREAIDYYISGGTGSELARSVLWHVHPISGMEYCYEIFKSGTDIETRRSAVELLRVVGDKRALKWAPEFLNDPDDGIQAWGAGLIDQLLWSGLIDVEDCSDVLEEMKGHQNSQVRERFEVIQESLANRKNHSEQGEEPDAGNA